MFPLFLSHRLVSMRSYRLVEMCCYRMRCQPNHRYNKRLNSLIKVEWARSCRICHPAG